MATVMIDSNDYTTYASIAEADEFLLADFGATDWRAETDEDQKARALVSATRLLNRMVWIGEKADEDQLLAWPRTGTGLSDIADDEIPQEIVDASIVLAKLIHAGSSVDSSATSTSNIKRQQAGSVSIEYFSPELVVDATRLPTEVFELVRRFLGGNPVAASSFGTCGDSITESDYTPGWGA